MILILIILILFGSENINGFRFPHNEHNNNNGNSNFNNNNNGYNGKDNYNNGYNNGYNGNNNYNNNNEYNNGNNNYNNNLTSCQYHNLAYQICCNGFLQNKIGSFPACCGPQSYDIAINKCCFGVIRQYC